MHHGRMALKHPLQPLEAVGRDGVFARIMEGLASEGADEKTVMIPATSLKAHRTVSSLRMKKGGGDDKRERLTGHARGGLNTWLQAVTDAKGRPLRFFMTMGQVSDDTGAAARPGGLSAAKWLIADRDHRACGAPRPIRQAAIQAAEPDQHHVRRAERPTPHRHARRHVPEGLPICRPARRNRHLLALKINKSGAWAKTDPFQTRNFVISHILKCCSIGAALSTYARTSRS